MAIENVGKQQSFVNGETVALPEFRCVMIDTDGDYNCKFTNGLNVQPIGIVAAGESAAVGAPVTVNMLTGGAILKMRMGATVKRGSWVRPTSSGYVTSCPAALVATSPVLGIALQSATASKDIIPVMVQYMAPKG